MKGTITLIQHFSVHDGPGIRTTVFFKGCPLKCWWCHNPENIKIEPELMFYKTTGVKSIVGKEVDVETVVKEILKDKLFYDETGGGVTFSGGEPTLQFKFLKSLAKLCREHKINTALDTCGYVDTNRLNEILELIDIFIYDIKLIDKEKHRKFTGVDNTIILENFYNLYKQKQNIIMRIPLIGGVNDTKKDIDDFKSFIQTLKPQENFVIEVLPYHKFGESKYEALNRPYLITNGEVSNEIVEEYLKMIKSLGFNVRINTW